MKKLIGIVVLVVIVVVILIVSQGSSAPASNGPIRIAFIGPLTGDGAAWGEIEKNTIQLAVDEINGAGGIKGRSIAITYEDGKCEGPTSVSAAKKLVEVDHIGILLISCSQEILPIAPYANEHKVIALTSYASASQITDAGSYIFRNSYTNRDMARSMAEIAKQKGTKAAIISEQSAFATDLADIFVHTAFPSVGGTIVAEENFPQGTKDFRSQILKIIASNPSVVVVNPNGPATGVSLLKQFRQLGYKGPFVGNFFGGSKEVQSLSEAQGMVYVSDPIFSDSPIKQKVFSAYKEKYSKSPDLEWPVGARYDAIYLLKQAFENVGDDPTAVRDYLHNLPQDFTGVLGTYRFNKDNADITNVKPSVAIVENYSSSAVK